MDRRRFGRQLRLAEIGEAGQERLLAATVALGGAGLAREVERTYVERAGARTTEGSTEEVDIASLELRHAAARDVGEGALRALVAMRAILGLR